MLVGVLAKVIGRLALVRPACDGHWLAHRGEELACDGDGLTRPPSTIGSKTMGM
jgi:hypothetical protein